jgi:uncharacterized membrane protein YfcA
MGWREMLLLFTGGVLAGGINVMAGGAGFMTFPLLIAAGMSELEANASNFVALAPANVVGVAAYRRELRNVHRIGSRLILAAVGGTAGSLLLVWAGQASFQKAVPWLLLAATVSFAIGPWIKRKLEQHYAFNGRQWVWLSFIFEFIVYAYGGYFGLGMGIVLLALYAIFGHEDIHEANALRNATIIVVTIIGIVIFARAGVIRWLPSLVMMAGAVLGGYAMIRFSRKVSPGLVHNAILGWASVLTAYAFRRYL